jgi:hypothetical protein
MPIPEVDNLIDFVMKAAHIFCALACGRKLIVKVPLLFDYSHCLSERILDLLRANLSGKAPMRLSAFGWE